MKSGNILLEVENLSKTFQQHQAVKEISFHMEKGTCIAIIGPNGAGKTTTLQMLAGLLTPTSGTIHLHDGKKKDYRQLIGYLPQHPSFFPWMTAKEFLQFAGRLSHLTKSQLAAKIDETLSFVSLLNAKNKKVGGFSGGMKQRLGLAQALIHDPELLILDEPVSALDPNGRRDVLEILQSLKTRMTILFSTHVLHDAEQVCDSVIMLKNGMIKWNGSLASLKHHHSTIAFKIRTAESLKNCFEDLPMLTRIKYLDLNTAVLTVEDASFDTSILLTRILENHLTLMHFEPFQDSLEDAYLEVMKD